MTKYRKQPVVIDAEQWWPDDVHEPQYICRSEAKSTDQCALIMPPHIHTLEGSHLVSPGDWLITGVKGEHYACKPDIFAMTYELAE